MWRLEDSSGRQIALPRLPLILGSAQDADVVLPHASVAPQHARFRAGEDGTLLVEALGAAVVEIAGWQVQRANLHAGEEVLLGHLSFRVAWASPADAGPTGTTSRARPGLLHADVSQVGGPLRFVMLLALAALAVGLAWGLQRLVRTWLGS